MMLVLLTTVGEVQVVPPIVTVAPEIKFVPVRVREVAPASFPLLELIEVSVGRLL